MSAHITQQSSMIKEDSLDEKDQIMAGVSRDGETGMQAEITYDTFDAPGADGGNNNSSSNDADMVEDPRREPVDNSCCGRFLGFFSALIPPGSLPATVFSTAATAMGGGILGLPSAFLKAGAVLGFMWVALIGLTTMYSLRLLALTSDITGERSYERLAQVLLGRAGTYLVSAMRFLNCFGSMIAYVMLIGKLVKPILEGAGAPGWTTDTKGMWLMTSIFWLVFFFPLVIPREVNALRYVSTAGVLAMVFFCICVVAHFCQNGKAESIVLVGSGNDALDGIGVFMFSYICQVNQVELYREMRPSPTVPRFTLSASLSCIILAVLYGFTGLFGYLEFGEAMSGKSILDMYKPIDEPQFLIAFIGVFIKLMASYGLFGNVCLSAIYHTIGWEMAEVRFPLHLLFVVLLTLTTLALGLFYPSVESVFNFVGGICGGSLGFILPTLFYMYAGNWTLKTVGIFNYIAVYLVLCAGVFGMVCGTATTIYGFAT